MSDQVQMPGDADEAGEKTGLELKKARSLRKNSGEPTSDVSPDEATATTKKLDEAQDVTKRGPQSPAQHDGDGWGDDVPVQARGE